MARFVNGRVSGLCRGTYSGWLKRRVEWREVNRTCVNLDCERRLPSHSADCSSVVLKSNVATVGGRDGGRIDWFIYVHDLVLYRVLWSPDDAFCQGQAH